MVPLVSQLLLSKVRLSVVPGWHCESSEGPAEVLMHPFDFPVCLGMVRRCSEMGDTQSCEVRGNLMSHELLAAVCYNGFGLATFAHQRLQQELICFRRARE